MYNNHDIANVAGASVAADIDILVHGSLSMTSSQSALLVIIIRKVDRIRILKS